MKRIVIVMAKEPRPGKVKTRLAVDVGADVAARLAKAFLLDTVEAVHGVDGAAVVIAYDPPSGRDWFERECSPFDIDLVEQATGDLGVRMERAFRTQFERGGVQCVMVGMDTPQVTASRLEDAFAALEDHGVCLGPSEDGGYYLLGLARHQPTLFTGVAWSTQDVFAETMRRVEALGQAAHLLPRERDVDDRADLTALSETIRGRIEAPATPELMESAHRYCPRTRAALEDLRLP